MSKAVPSPDKQAHGMVPYMIGLLRKGLGVPESRIQMGSGREPWTLGAALAEGAKAGAGSSRGDAVLSRSAALVAAMVAFLGWLVFLGYTLKSSGGTPASLDRKASGATSSGHANRIHPLHSSAPNSASKVSLKNLPQGPPHPLTPASPTAVIGGSTFNSNPGRQASQRKRINSVDNLQALQ